MLSVGAPKATEQTGKPTLRLDIKLGDPTGVVVDFMHMAEEKYGYDVVHPEVKAAALDLVGDDDNDDDNDDDEVDLADNPLSGTAPATPAAAPKPKNRGKIEGKYDLNDPFIDDTEMLWEEQAASTKDGFFVYSGPLLNSDETPQIERADGSLKKITAGSAANGTGNQTAAKPKQTRKKKASAETKEKDAPVKKKAKKKPEKEKPEKPVKADKHEKSEKDKENKTNTSDPAAAATSDTTVG